MHNRPILPFLFLLAAISFSMSRPSVSAAQTTTRPTEAATLPTTARVVLSLQAGQHDRLDVPVSVSIDAGAAQSVWVEFPDGTLGRSQLVEPGLLNVAGRGRGKKELHFGVPKMAKGESLQVVAMLSDQPAEGRSYVWSGEPRQSRRLSCSQCHQGVSLPTTEELRRERTMLDEKGTVPPLELPRVMPTAKGRDFRWHQALGRFQSSACWECHGRHMVEYEFGQSIEKGLPWAPDPPARDRVESQTVFQNPYHQVFRLKGDRTFSVTPSGEAASPGGVAPCGIHYGFGPQQHRGILSEEAGKFVGRHGVLIDWLGRPSEKMDANVAVKQDGESNGKRTAIAREERQLTVKNMRARNGSYALWIDFVLEARSLRGTIRLDEPGPLAGFRFVPPIDAGSVPEYRETPDSKAITFVFGGMTYTAVCFNHPGNPKPLVEGPADRERVGEGPGRPGLFHQIGFGFRAELDEPSPLVVHYRLWFQEGRMPSEEIQAMSDDFLQPIGIEVQPH